MVILSDIMFQPVYNITLSKHTTAKKFPAISVFPKIYLHG